LPNHYEITADEQGYFFLTDLSVTYRIVFDDLSSIFQDYPTLTGRVFSYSFYPVNEPSSRQKLDDRIRHTIAHSINSFFEKNNNLIVFVCDSTDEREMCRKKLFDKWFTLFNDGILEKYDGSVESNDYRIANSLILKNDLYDKEYVIQTFRELNDQFSRAK
jgi:Family of unknown function (DUF6169)